ncbi:piggyBac transposable element-derived protein 1 [Danaus plexippus plexippus]|uniref:PiggyBac transposable element-derived protein 1 n=1 Tax=Danaus plexippus plexippus TaxID=278856 RepID=A0A212EMV7_DANPL|nr:piggyBac transposable element-derived protein 1 [Danaus plexippus plexippus]
MSAKPNGGQQRRRAESPPQSNVISQQLETILNRLTALEQQLTSVEHGPMSLRASTLETSFETGDVRRDLREVPAPTERPLLSPGSTAATEVAEKFLEAITSLTTEGDDEEMVTAFLPRDVPGNIEDFRVHEDNIQSDDSSDEEALAEKANRRRKQLCRPVWRKCSPTYSSTTEERTNVQERQEAVNEQLGELSPVQIFEKMLDEEVTTLIITNTIEYANQNNRHTFQLDFIDLKKFIGILILSGYHKLPREDLYWSYDEDVGVEMSRSVRKRQLRISAGGSSSGRIPKVAATTSAKRGSGQPPITRMNVGLTKAKEAVDRQKRDSFLLDSQEEITREQMVSNCNELVPYTQKRRKGKPVKRWSDDIVATDGITWAGLARNRDTRREMEEAFTARASDYSAGERDEAVFGNSLPWEIGIYSVQRPIFQNLKNQTILFSVADFLLKQLSIVVKEKDPPG